MWSDSVMEEHLNLDGHLRHTRVSARFAPDGRVAEMHRVVEWEMSDAHWVEHAAPWSHRLHEATAWARQAGVL